MHLGRHSRCSASDKTPLRDIHSRRYHTGASGPSRARPKLALLYLPQLAWPAQLHRTRKPTAPPAAYSTFTFCPSSLFGGTSPVGRGSCSSLLEVEESDSDDDAPSLLLEVALDEEDSAIGAAPSKASGASSPDSSKTKALAAALGGARSAAAARASTR